MISFVNWEQQLALAVVAPAALYVGSTTASAAFDAAKSTFGPTLSKLEAEANKPTEEDKQKMKWWQKLLLFVVILSIILALEAGFALVIQYISKRVDAKWVTGGLIMLMSACFGWANGAQVASYMGYTSLSVARTQDGALVWKHKNLPALTRLLFVVPGIAATAFALFKPASVLSAAILTFFPIAMFSTLMPAGPNSKKPISLRWRFFGFMIMGAGIFGFAGLVLLLVQLPGADRALENFGKSFDGLTGEKKEGVSTDVDPRTTVGIMFVQSVMTTSFMIAPLIAMIYRFDVSNEREKGTAGYETLVVKEVGEELHGLKGAVTGSSAVVPSFSAIMAAKTRRSLLASVRLYSVAAVLTTVCLTFGVPQIIVWFLSTYASGFEEKAKFKDLSAIIQSGQVLGIYMAPSTMVVVLGLLSYSRGEFKKLYNYREIWGGEKNDGDEDVVASLLEGDELKINEEISTVA